MKHDYIVLFYSKVIFSLVIRHANFTNLNALYSVLQWFTHTTNQMQGQYGGLSFEHHTSIGVHILACEAIFRHDGS